MSIITTQETNKNNIISSTDLIIQKTEEGIALSLNHLNNVRKKLPCGCVCLFNMHVCMLAYIVCMFVCIYMYVYRMYVCMYIYVCVCTHVLRYSYKCLRNS